MPLFLESPLTRIDSIARAVVYKLLSRSFKSPTSEVFGEFQNGDFASELWDNLSALPYMLPFLQENAGLIEKMAEGMKECSFAGFAAAYARTFVEGVPAPPCPPVESHHLDCHGRLPVSQEVCECYRQFGLKMNEGSGLHPPPDHISAELEFMHFLTVREATAMEDSREDLIRVFLFAQKDFLKSHIISWLPRLCRKLQEEGQLPFFADLAMVAGRFTILDHASVCSRLGAPD